MNKSELRLNDITTENDKIKISFLRRLDENDSVALEHAERIKEATSFLKNTHVLERVYCIVNDISSKPKCANSKCDNTLSFKDSCYGYGKYCSYKCRPKKKLKSYNPSIDLSEEQLYHLIVNCKYSPLAISLQIGVDWKIVFEILSQYDWFELSHYVDTLRDRQLYYENCYIIEQLPLSEISDQLGLSQEEIKKTLIGLHIPIIPNEKRSNKSSKEVLKNIKNKEWLIHQHITLYKSVTQIAHENNVDYELIEEQLKIHNIQINRVVELLKNRIPLYDLIHNMRVEYRLDDLRTAYPYCLDIFLPNHKLAINFYNPFWIKDIKEYHDDIVKKCKERNIRVIAIYQDEWLSNPTKIKNKIKTIIMKTSDKQDNVKPIDPFADGPTEQIKV